MTDVATWLAIMQHADSQFPSGGFAFSWGLEQLAADGQFARTDLAGFVAGQLRYRWAEFDRLAVAQSNARHADPQALAALDDMVDAMTVGAVQREGSRRAGQALLDVHARLKTPGAQEYARHVREGAAAGHACVVLGLVLAGVGLRGPAALAVAAYGTANSFCTAAVRLGLAGHLDAQHTLTRTRPLIVQLVGLPLRPIEDAAPFAPLAEIAMMRHDKRSLHLFST